MSVLRWSECTRGELSAALPEALVVLPIGATEQHGPHLATGTDALLATEIVDRAVPVAAARAERALVIAPTLSYGASDHHLPFGGTLSLSVETLLSVLVDIGRSVAAGGGRRLVIVNGHGGNQGVCHAAGSAISTRYAVAVAHLDYWSVLPPEPTAPGHAGVFETSLVLGVRPDLVRDRHPRENLPSGPKVANAGVHSAAVWDDIDGYTDDPAQATAVDGKARLDLLVSEMALRLVECARQL
ncbi:creatininase family protein [Fodinicola feengrottensis]|uniref:Creatininase family protein n=1 Tax=Fodinicola feengrottensis TaxID=435914 RepID=A0ABN2INY8_9ACTN